ESDTATLAGHYANWLRKHHPDSLHLLEPAQAEQPPPADLDEIWRSAIPAEQHYNSWISDCAVAFLQRNAKNDQPFFLFVSYPDPHHPFDPPGQYADRYDPQLIPLPPVTADELKRQPSYYGELYPKGDGFRELYWAGRTDLEAGSMITTESISEESMRRAIAYTYGMIEMIDDGIGRIERALKQQGVAENTVIVFTSDHGELLGDHGLLHKGPPPYRQLTEVSLLIQGPGIVSGETTQALTNHVDLAPTLLELSGIEYDENQFDGVSLKPILSGDKTEFRSWNFGEYHPSAKPDLYNQTINTENWRLTLYPSHPEWGEMFDLENDPQERSNVFNEPAMQSVKSELSEVLNREFPPQPSVDNEWICKW
ncbi:MAG: sulfatase family protein, partial [bacterium]